MKLRNRSIWLWLGVALTTASGTLFGAILGIPTGKAFAGVLIGLATGFALGLYGARKSVDK